VDCLLDSRSPTERDISVIVPVWNENSFAQLRNCLRSLFEVLENDDETILDVEVIIVEIGSLDMVKRFQRRDGVLLAIDLFRLSNKNIQLLEPKEGESSTLE
jgi:hypothetical protein